MHKSILIFPVLFSLILSGCSFTLAQDITPPPGYTPAATMPPAPTASLYPLLPPSVVSGEQAYLAECSACHGIKGLGDGAQATSQSQPPAPLRNQERTAATSLIGWYDLIANHGSVSSMPDFSAVMDARTRWDIAAYLYQLNTSEEQVRLGQQLYENNCLQCHGVEGKGDGSQASGLTLSPPDFTFQRILPARSDAQLIEFVANGSGNVMPAYGSLFSQEELDAVVKYVRYFSFAENPWDTALTSTPQPVETQLEDGQTVSESTDSEPTAITVTGKLIHDSGNPLPAAQKVVLRIFDNMEETGSLEMLAAADGSFLFENVPMNAGRILIATTSYDGQTFNSDPSRHLNPETQEQAADPSILKLDIHISDSTTDTSTISVERLHIFFDFSQENVVQIVQLYLISNSGSQTIVAPGEEQGVLNFQLPAQARNLQFQDSVIGQRYLAIDGGFSDTAPVPPGSMSTQVLYAIDLPYDGQAEISLPIPYPTDSVIVMAPLSGVELDSDFLIDGGVKSAAENTFRVHTASNLTAGSTLSFRLSGNPDSENAQAGGLKFNTAWIGAAALVLVVMSSLFYLYQKKAATSKPAPSVSVPGNPEAIMDSIIALDAQYKAGHLTDAAYQERRTELKEQLKKIT